VTSSATAGDGVGDALERGDALGLGAAGAGALGDGDARGGGAVGDGGVGESASALRGGAARVRQTTARARRRCTRKRT
jgi:hypothetical protein